MKRMLWTKSKEVECKEVDAFLIEIEEVCKKHGLTIASGSMADSTLMVDDMNESSLEAIKNAEVYIGVLDS